jgi:hypothetical protein
MKKVPIHAALHFRATLEAPARSPEITQNSIGFTIKIMDKII